MSSVAAGPYSRTAFCSQLHRRRCHVRGPIGVTHPIRGSGVLIWLLFISMSNRWQHSTYVRWLGVSVQCSCYKRTSCRVSELTPSTEKLWLQETDGFKTGKRRTKAFFTVELSYKLRVAWTLVDFWRNNKSGRNFSTFRRSVLPPSSR